MSTRLRCLPQKNCGSLQPLFIFTLHAAEETQYHVPQRAKPQISRCIFGKNQRYSRGNVLYIDELGIQSQIYRQYARSKCGKQVNVCISGKRHALICLVAAHGEGDGTTSKIKRSGTLPQKEPTPTRFRKRLRAPSSICIKNAAIKSFLLRDARARKAISGTNSINAPKLSAIRSALKT